MHTARKLLRIFGAIFSLSLRGELAFRVSLIFHCVTTLIGVAAGLAALGIVYTQTETLGGWRLGETLVLLGTFQIMEALLATFVLPNLLWFSGQIKDGKLDEVLLKPVPAIFLASLGTCNLLGLFQVLVGIGIVVFGLMQLALFPTLWGILSWLVMLGAGIIITWALRVMLASVAFWSPAVELDVIYSTLWEFGRYPASIYQQPLRFILTYIVPVAFIATVPTSMLVRSVDIWQLLIGILFAVGTFILVFLVWNAGLRRYTSATS